MFQSRKRPAVRDIIISSRSTTSSEDRRDGSHSPASPASPSSPASPASPDDLFGFDRVTSSNNDNDDPNEAPAPATRIGLATGIVQQALPSTPAALPTASSPSSTPSVTSNSASAQSASTSSSSSASSSAPPSSAPSSSAPASSTPSLPSTSSIPTISSSLPAASATQSSTNQNHLPDNQGALSQGHHSGLAGGAVAGIVIVILLALLGVAAFFFRKRLMRGRSLRRSFWKAGVAAAPDDFSAIEKGAGGIIEPAAPGGGITPFTLGAPPVMRAAAERADDPFGDQHSIASRTGTGTGPAPVSTVTRKPPPALDTQALAVPPALVLPRSPARSSPATPRSSASPVLFEQGSASLVRVTFIPSMPDELSIEPGETIRIAAVYDDGWALCANAQGQQGMVPLECLEGGGGHFAGMPAGGGVEAVDNARIKRGSSLYTRRASGSSSLMK
ncbi:hypothetical protein DENSPDRAFT_834796 [Dentipellis sp. KUC8613]|nr:hypothetical protein DENSPDRAFT_834796 [Dentipellis sp. KUC8613]